MDEQEKARRRRLRMLGIQNILSGLVKILFLVLFVYFILRYFAR